MKNEDVYKRQIERNLISMRTKEALERRRKEGKHLGRKKGDTPKMKILYANKRKLVKMCIRDRWIPVVILCKS